MREICASCKASIWQRQGHSLGCPIRRHDEWWAQRQATGTDRYTPGGDEYDEYRITGGLTESEFFGGDIGDKG